MCGLNKLKVLILCAVCSVLIACKGSGNGSNEARGNQWSEFYGTFRGNAESVLSGELSERELEVVIKPWEERGFTVEWTTLIHRADGEKKMTDLSIDFYPAERPGIFASAMQTNVFGQTVPYDPVAKDADPYVWAGLDGDTLTVFQRLANGEKVTQVSAQLDEIVK